VFPSGVTPSFLLLFLFVSSTLHHPFPFRFSPLSSCPDVPHPASFPGAQNDLPRPIYTLLHFNLLFSDRLPSCTSFQFLMVPELLWPLRFCSFPYILAAYSRTSTESPHCLVGPLFSLPVPLLSRRLSFLLCSSFHPSIDSDVFPYRRLFSFFQYYSGVIRSFFLFPRAAT
jgi:hypothetical protein